MGNIELMTSRPDNSEQSYSEQLSDFEGQLKQTMDDASLLQDVHRTIRELLKEHRDSEADIRNILLTRLESGALRQESYQLVRTMLDRIVSDDVDTLPGLDERDDIGTSDFGETDVIATQSLDADNPEERLQVGSVLRDRFLLKERVAGGSMGVVYKALDRRLAEADAAEPWVAIKVLSPKLSRNGNALRALQQEAAKGRCLSHPNIVRFLDLDRDDELYFIVMEWLEGRSLANILDDAKSNKMDVATALDIVNQLGRALDYAHRCGVVHADVKPANVMIVPSGQVKLFDFGVARIRQKQSDTLSKFDPAVLGAVTPAYSSMQVLTGDEPVPADDVFSLACLMYRLIAGYRVFGPRNAAEAAESGMEPQRPNGLSDSQWRALKKALAYSRVARYSSPKEFIDDLQSAEVEPPAQVSVGEPLRESVDMGSPRRWPYAFLVSALLVTAAYVVTETTLLDAYFPWLQDEVAIVATPAEVVSQRPEITALDLAAEAVAPENESSDDRAAIDTVTDVTGEAAMALSASSEDAVSVYDVFGDNYPHELAQTITAVDTLDSDPVVVTETMQPATHALTLSRSGVSTQKLGITLREGAGPAIVDLHRTEGIGVPLTLRIEEVGFSGNRSPGSTGKYKLSNDGIVEFAVDQATAQTIISLASDAVSEPDRQVALRVRVADNPRSELGFINLTLEDDDRRDIEANLAANTVAFWLDQISVRESDPAVQIDVLRLNPDSQELEVDYVVRDITATEGEDYFAPSVTTISFGPNQRSARLLIPLVQDSKVEMDETFVLEIIAASAENEANINRRITVIIRDDDIAAQ
ncbi:MAG: protein kinase [Proteobacteria bacterium]|nr:protein kinase [Pseudomonadota bacterium]